MTRKWQQRGGTVKLCLTVVVPIAPAAREDTLKLRWGVPSAFGLAPRVPDSSRVAGRELAQTHLGLREGLCLNLPRKTGIRKGGHTLHAALAFWRYSQVLHGTRRAV